MSDTSSTPPATPPVKQANQRGAASLAAVQALYQMDIGGTGVLEIVAEYEAHRLGQEIDGETYLKADASWFRSIVAGVVRDQRTLDPLIGTALQDDWALSRLDSTVRAILRAGTFETGRTQGCAGRRHRHGICRDRQGVLRRRGTQARQCNPRPYRQARSARTSRSKAISAWTLSRGNGQANDTGPACRPPQCLSADGCPGCSGNARSDLVCRRRCCRLPAAWRRQVAGDGAAHRVQHRRCDRCGSGCAVFPSARTAGRFHRRCASGRLRWCDCRHCAVS